MTVAELAAALLALPPEQQGMTVLFKTCEGPIPFTDEPKVEEAYHHGDPNAYYGWSIDYMADETTEEDKAADDADYGHTRAKVVTL